MHCIVKTVDGSKGLDNLAIRCIEEAKDRREGSSFTSIRIQTDGDANKTFTTYQGSESGDVALLGGMGKHQDMTGKGTSSVVHEPGNTAQLFAFTRTSR